MACAVRSLALVLFFQSIVYGDAYLGSAYEPFDYPAGASLFNVNGGTGFNAFGDSSAPNSFRWGGSGVSRQSGNTVVVAGNLSGSLPPSTGNRASFTGGSPAVGQIGRSLGQFVDEGSLYFSYYTARANSFERSMNFALFNGETEKLAIGQFGSGSVNTHGDFAISFFNNSGNLRVSDTPINYGTGVTHLVIGRVDFNASGVNERVRIYIDPAQITDESQLVPYLDISDFDLGTVSAFRPFAGDAGTLGQVTAEFDEIRFGATFSTVTVPEPGVAWSLLVGTLVVSLRKRRSAPQRLCRGA
jgi:hypothetical protein